MAIDRRVACACLVGPDGRIAYRSTLATEVNGTVLYLQLLPKRKKKVGTTVVGLHTCHCLKQLFHRACCEDKEDVLGKCWKAYLGVSSWYFRW